MKSKLPSLLFYLVGLLGLASHVPCFAVLMHNGANDADHIALGVEHSTQVLWLKVDWEYQDQKGTYHVPAVRINDHYAITSAHGVHSNTPGVLRRFVKIGDGTNYLTNPGNVREVAQVIVHPEYFNSSLFSQPDIAIIKLAQPLAGSNAVFGPATSVAKFEKLTSSGFGVPGYVGIGFLPIDGQIRGWIAEVSSDTSGHYNNEYFGSTRFNTNPYQLNGRGSSADSGGPVYDSQRRLVGITVGVAPTDYSLGGITIFLDLTIPTIQSWIVANTTLSGPPSISCTITDTQAMLTLNNLLPTRDYRIMRSSNLRTWEEAHYFTAIGSTGSWSAALVPEGTQFFRLEWNE
jgi:hypothetical protein